MKDSVQPDGCQTYEPSILRHALNDHYSQTHLIIIQFTRLVWQSKQNENQIKSNHNNISNKSETKQNKTKHENATLFLFKSNQQHLTNVVNQDSLH